MYKALLSLALAALSLFGIIGLDEFSRLIPLPANELFAAIAGSGSGLVAHYTFDEGSGTSVGDSSGNGLSGSFSGTPEPNWVSGKIGSGAIKFNSGGIVRIPHSSALSVSSITISFWSKFEEISNVHRLMTKAGDFVVRTTGGGAMEVAAGIFFYSNSKSDTNWNHWTYTADGTEYKWYKNGILDRTVTSAWVTPSGTQALEVGGSIDPFNGTIDDLRIYSRALSVSEILELYALGSAGTPAPTGVSGSCGATINTCTAGSFSDIADSSTNHLWECTGSGGGTTASCSLAISPVVGDTAAPIISSVTASSITSNSATISWSTNEASDTQIEYGLTSSYGSYSPLHSIQSTSHVQTLTSLSSNTIYHYRVRSVDSSGNLALGSNNTFITASAAPTPAPVTSGTYYIDFDSGSDTNSGTMSSPWKHSPGDSAATGNANKSLVPGETVIFKGGVVYQGHIVPTNSGSSAGRISYKGNTGWGSGRAIIEGAGTRSLAFDVEADYITVEGFEMRNQVNTGVSVEAYNYTTLTSKGHHLVISDNVIHDIGISGSGSGKGIHIAYVDDILISGNEIYNTQYDAITLSTKCSNVTIRDNHLYDGEVDGIKAVASGTFIIENNSIHGFDNNVNHGDGMQILGFSDTLIIRNNRMHSNGQTIFLEPYSNPVNTVPAGKVYVYNNLLTCPTYTPATPCGHGIGMNAWNTVEEAHFYNNTIIGYSSGWGGVSIGYKSQLLTALGGAKPYGIVSIKNNILYNSSASALMSPIWADSFVLDHNIYFNTAGTQKYLPGNGSNGAGLAQYKTENPGLEVHGMNVDPILDSDFKLQATSPAVNAGASLASFLTTDILGTSRPQGAAWDIGAYEYYSGQPAPAPYVPTATPSTPSTPTAPAPSVPVVPVPSAQTAAQALQTTCTTQTSTSTLSFSAFAQTLSLGVTHPEVKTLQQLLNANGYTISASGPGSKGFETSYYGLATERAVKALQSKYKITPTGTVGSITRLVLSTLPFKITTLSNCGTSTTKSVSLPTKPAAAATLFTTALDVGSSGPEVVLLQTVLSKYPSIYPEKLVTGTFGPLTQSAVGRFQFEHNLSKPGDRAYGFVGPATRAKLNSLLK